MNFGGKRLSQTTGKDAIKPFSDGGLRNNCLTLAGFAYSYLIITVVPGDFLIRALTLGRCTHHWHLNYRPEHACIMHMEGHSDRIVRWELTGAEKAVEVQEAWLKNWMWWSAARARRLQRPPPSPASPPTRAQAHTGISNAGTHIHAPHSPLPQPASPPPPDPVSPSSPLRHITPSPPICHSSPALHLFSPLVSLLLAPRRSAHCWCEGRQRGE